MKFYWTILHLLQTVDGSNFVIFVMPLNSAPEWLPIRRQKQMKKKITRLQSVFFQVLTVVINLSGRLYIVPTKYDKHCLLKWGVLHS